VRIALSHVRVFVRAIGLRSRSRSICRSFSRARCSSLQLVQWDSASPTSPSDRDGAGLERSGARTSDPQLVERAWYFATVRRLGRTARSQAVSSPARLPPGAVVGHHSFPRSFRWSLKKVCLGARQDDERESCDGRGTSSSISSAPRYVSGRLVFPLRRTAVSPLIPQASRSGQNFVALRHRADRRPAGKPSPDVRHVHRPATEGSAVGMARDGPGPSTNLSPHAARYAGVPTGSPCVLVLGLCGLCRSNCRTIGLLRARRCDA
jgi:hypothetical protein